MRPHVKYEVSREPLSDSDQRSTLVWEQIEEGDEEVRRDSRGTNRGRGRESKKRLPWGLTLRGRVRDERRFTTNPLLLREDFLQYTPSLHETTSGQVIEL